MVHLVYCDNTGKKGEKVLDKILNGTKTMVVRGAAGRKIPHSRVFQGETLNYSSSGGGDFVSTCVRITDSAAGCCQGLGKSQQSDHGHCADPGISGFPLWCRTGNKVHFGHN